MTYGVYFYPWYNEERWGHHKRHNTSLRACYDSSDQALIEWQTRAIVESGFDFVVIESVMPGDWCYEFMMNATGKAIKAFREAGISWSFMIDAFVMDKPAEHSQKIICELNIYADNGWLDGLVSTEDSKPDIFTFGAHPQTVDELAEHSAGKFNYHHVAWFRHWGVPSVSDNLPVFDAFNDRVRASNKQATYREVLVPMGYIPFWQPTEQIFNANGFATACPGYDDRLLRRTPQIAPVLQRENGDTFRKQLSKARASGADNILIYGWNEYFEATTIEPSYEFGDQYLKIVKEHIISARTSWT
jgi:hypothetical protein